MSDRTSKIRDRHEDLSSELALALPTSSGLYWDGQWHTPAHAATLSSFNPSTGEPLRDILIGGQEEVNAAVSAAKAAGPAWRRTPPLERGRRLREAASRIRAHAQELALIDAADRGNPVKAMMMDAEIAATQLEYFAGLTLEVKGETIPTGN